MKQTDNIDKALSTFKILAATQAAATENGDYKKGNKAFKQIIQIIKYLKELGRVNELEALLSDSNVGEECLLPMAYCKHLRMSQFPYLKKSHKGKTYILLQQK